jgi:endoglucanase
MDGRFDDRGHDDHVHPGPTEPATPGERWGSLRYATGAAYSAALLYDATGVPRYRDFAMAQLAYVNGNNEYGRSFVVGQGRNPPRAPHHRNAYGRDFFDEHLAHRFELAGALVGGPTPDGYVDSIHDYVGNEVTIDYNTGLVGLAAPVLVA